MFKAMASMVSNVLMILLILLECIQLDEHIWCKLFLIYLDERLWIVPGSPIHQVVQCRLHKPIEITVFGSSVYWTVTSQFLFISAV